MADTNSPATTTSTGAPITKAADKDVATPGPGIASDGEKGTTTIADGVVTKVAGLAAREVAGVHDLGGGASRAVGQVAQRVGLGERTTQGVNVEVGTREAAVDVKVVIDYGESIPEVAGNVRDQIVKRVEGITGLTVKEVNVAVEDLYFPGDDDEDDANESGVRVA